MLINVSNHPSENWSDKQIQAAYTLYGIVNDLPFPQIPAGADEKEVCGIADRYLETIRDILAASGDSSDAVMVQGEYTFTYALVERLKKHGIKAVSACSNRHVTESVNEDGTTEKHAVFMFVRFREYGIL